MDKEKFYEYLEEADKGEIMEILDATINRFRELFDDQELVVITLSKDDRRKTELERVIEMLKQQG